MHYQINQVIIQQVYVLEPMKCQMMIANSSVMIIALLANYFILLKDLINPYFSGIFLQTQTNYAYQSFMISLIKYLVIFLIREFFLIALCLLVHLFFLNHLLITYSDLLCSNGLRELFKRLFLLLVILDFIHQQLQEKTFELFIDIN